MLSMCIFGLPARLIQASVCSFHNDGFKVCTFCKPRIRLFGPFQEIPREGHLVS
ncbi:unnamed protein product [Rhodiola kirilowii]